MKEEAKNHDNYRCKYDSNVLSTFAGKEQCVETKDCFLINGLLCNVVAGTDT
jgi:hypothetical protein